METKRPTETLSTSAHAVLDQEKAEAIRRFIDHVGGMENARKALEALAELERRAA